MKSEAATHGSSWPRQREPRLAALAPGYGKYATQTDREIPVVRLTPRRAEG